MSQNISFSSATAEFLEDNLKIIETTHNPVMEEFLDINNIEITTAQQETLQLLADKGLILIETWTEQELITKHIAPIINLVDYFGDGYNDFADRTFGYDFGDINLSGAMDLLIARGKREPKTPYFCLHEYKKERNGKGEPRGQLLAEMLVAQALNRDAKTNFDTIYGCYIVGRNWFWVVLKDKEYAVSKAYDSTQIEDLEEIFMILMKVKQIIEEHIRVQKLLQR
jgi:hypothetical protein